jgi:hypothetical protein
MIRFTGMQYFLNSIGVETSNVFSSFTFYSGFSNNTFVYPDLWATSSASGILNTGINGSVTGSFYQNSGTGFFNGSAIMKLNSPYTFENDTILLSYERLRTGDEILLSSATGNSFSTYSGFCVGVNHANKLYFKYWNPVEGVFTFTARNKLANKNLILLNKYDNILTIGKFNNNLIDFETEIFTFKENAFRQNSELFVGGMYNSVPWANDQASNFSGYIDKFFIFKNSLLSYKNDYVSGIVHSISGSLGITGIECYITGYLTGSGFSTSGVTGFLNTPFSITGTGITGYATGIRPYSYSGVTSYTNSSLGFFADSCNNLIQIFTQIPITGRITINSNVLSGITGLIITTGFNQTPLTGSITGIVNTYVTGQICNQTFVKTGEDIFYKDNNYFKSLSYSEISYFSPVNSSTDILEVYYENYSDRSLNYNNNLLFNIIDDSFFSNNFVDETVLPSGLLLFLNGQLILDSGFFLRTSGYDTFITPTIDYYRTGNTIYVNESIGINDNIFYDYFTGNSEILCITGIGSGHQVLNRNFTNNLVFLNGQKLISGVTYTGINTINIPIPSGTGYIFLKSISPLVQYRSGNSSVLLINNNLNQNCSQLYFNGIKQQINQNYIENSNFDLYSGTIDPIINNFIIYNNTNDFFV